MIYADLRHRYKTVLQLVPKNSNVCLDIGGYTSGTYACLFSDFGLCAESINLVQDLDLNNIPTYQSNFLYFSSSKKYDYTFLIDVIEHVDNTERIEMIEKAINIAQEGTYILFPYLCKDNLYLEERIRNLFLMNDCKIKSSFEEHMDYGLPEKRMIFDYLDRNNIKYTFKYVTDKNLFYDLFEKQFSINDNRERLRFCIEQTNKLNVVPLSDCSLNKYRILFAIVK